MANLHILKALDNNIYSVTPSVQTLTTSETTLVSDYGDPAVSLGGSIDVVSTARQVNYQNGTLVGTFVVGETVTGGTSAATGVVFLVETDTFKLHLTGVTGTFGNDEEIEGGTSLATVQTAVSGALGGLNKLFLLTYGVAPESTANFTVNSVTRKVVSQLPLTFKFNGNTNTEAEQNANDFIIQIKENVQAVWDVLLANLNTFEEEEIVPL